MLEIGWWYHPFEHSLVARWAEAMNLGRESTRLYTAWTWFFFLHLRDHDPRHVGMERIPRISTKKNAGSCWDPLMLQRNFKGYHAGFHGFFRDQHWPSSKRFRRTQGAIGSISISDSASWLKWGWHGCHGCHGWAPLIFLAKSTKNRSQEVTWGHPKFIPSPRHGIEEPMKKDRCREKNWRSHAVLAWLAVSRSLPNIPSFKQWKLRSWGFPSQRWLSWGDVESSFSTFPVSIACESFWPGFCGRCIRTFGGCYCESLLFFRLGKTSKLCGTVSFVSSSCCLQIFDQKGAAT